MLKMFIMMMMIFICVCRIATGKRYEVSLIGLLSSQCMATYLCKWLTLPLYKYSAGIFDLIDYLKCTVVS